MNPYDLLAFAALSFTVIVVPGPSVLFAVSRALAAGRRAALLTVLGNASGVFVQILLVALGLGVLVAGSEAAHLMLTAIGGVYLMWLGAQAIRHRHAAARGLDADAPQASASPWRDGFVVGLTNPKTVVFLAAFLPRYVDAGAGHVAGQMIVLGAVFCLVAIICDSAWAVLAAWARSWFARDPRRLAWTAVAGGLVMIALGSLLLLG